MSGHVARLARDLARALGWAWLVYCAAYLGAGMVTHLAAGYDWPPARLVRFVPGMIWFATLMFVVTLLQTSPAWAVVVVARRRLGRRGCMALGALLCAAWGEWWVYSMEWFDVWRHGIPGWRYWLTVVVPAGVAWGAGGAALGSAIGRWRPAGLAAAHAEP